MEYEFGIVLDQVPILCRGDLMSMQGSMEYFQKTWSYMIRFGVLKCPLAYKSTRDVI